MILSSKHRRGDDDTPNSIEKTGSLTFPAHRQSLMHLANLCKSSFSFSTQKTRQTVVTWIISQLLHLGSLNQWCEP